MKNETLNIDALMAKFPREISVQDLYNIASGLAARDSLDEAEVLFEFLVSNRDRISPFFVGPSFFKLGEMVQKRGNQRAAQDYFRQCLQYTPHHFRASAYMGMHRQYLEEWQLFYNRLMEVAKKIKTGPPAGDGGDISGSGEIRTLWQNVSAETEVNRVHELFMQFFTYPLSPTPGETEEEYLNHLEERYQLQKDLYWKRLVLLPAADLEQWIIDTARQLNGIIEDNRIVEDAFRPQREFLFWAICVQLELLREVPFARKIAEHYFRRFTWSFILARQIMHLCLLKMPAAEIGGNGLVSIVTPYYNGERYVEETLSSIANQTYKDFEWIVVNDGSIDESSRALKKIAACYPHVNTRIITSDHVGQAAATNVGIRAAKGKYILPLDADDQIAVDYLEKAVGQFEKDGSLDVVYFMTVSFGFQNRLMIGDDFKNPGIFLYNQLNICSMVKKEAIDKVNGFNENIVGYEDWNMWITFAKMGMKFKWIPEVEFFYRRSLVSRGFRSMDKDYLKRKMIMECHPDIYRKPTEEEEFLLKQSYLYISPIFLK